MRGRSTINLMGTERSFAGRLRFSLDYLRRTEDIGIAGINQTQLTEQRTHFNLAYATNEWLNLAIRVPLVDKHLKYVNLGEQENQDLGDVEMSGKFTWFTAQDHSQQWGILAGLRLPTASERNDSKGKKLDIDVQAGTGAWTPSIGAWYGIYDFPYFAYGSVTYYHATEGFEKFQAGDVINATITGQYAFHKRIAAQVALDSRWSAKNKFGNQTDENSGGVMTFLSPKLIFMPIMDVVLHVGVQIPLFDQLNGEQSEGATIQFGIAYDF
ncbi:MAG: hypothetical protein R3E08_04995 [Thiotrichaceae bacterium]